MAMLPRPAATSRETAGSPAAPSARDCDHLLLAPAQHPVLSSSRLPRLALIEALLSDVLLSDPALVERAGGLAAIMSACLTDDTASRTGQRREPSQRCRSVSAARNASMFSAPDASARVTARTRLLIAASAVSTPSLS